MNAIDLALDRKRQFEDALKLAESAKPYIDGEQWAVTAVLLLRAEIKALKHYAGGA